MPQADWLITVWKKSICPLKQFILPAQAIHLAHSRNSSCPLKKFILPAQEIHLARS